MSLIFDISEDELPVFMAETSEQLQVLDEGLVRLEREDSAPELLQALFRAAHTLKGSAGMINHKRMVDLTHALESALDGVRKNQVSITPALIDACLEAVDALRFLTDEISTKEASPVEIPPLVQRFAEISSGQTNGKQAAASSSPAASKPAQAQKNGKTTANNTLPVFAKISPDSIASAARAFQLTMTLQEFGEIIEMDPSQALIETAAPVQEFRAVLKTNKPTNSELISELKKALSLISEVDQLQVGEPETQPEDAAVDLEPETRTNQSEEIPRLGDLLLKNGLITEAQLQQALSEHDKNQGPGALLGKTLVKLGMISQEVLDQVVSEQKPKSAPVRAPENQAEDRSRMRANAGEKTIRTSVERLDNLMNLVGELITDRNRLNKIRGDFEHRFRGDTEVDTLSETITHVGRITDQLQAEVMSIRMLPISNVFNKFPRLVRDLARKANKQVDLVTKGEDTELDRSVIEEISDPLIHLLRNAVDHGLETPAERLAAGKVERGTVLLTARHEQGRIIIMVEDDGRGIDLERVKNKAVEKGLLSEKEAAALSDEEAMDLIFIAGLSTAKTVSDVSGRGVGMDIVRNNIERLNGSILVETWPGRGTQFQIVLPLTLAIVPTLLVRVGKGTFAIPLVTVTETLRVAKKDIQTINARPVILLRNHVLPVTRLCDVFRVHEAANHKNQRYVVVVRSGKSQMGLIVDALVGEQEVVVKSLSSVVGDVTGISSAAILGDGQVALIVDVQGLFKLATQYQYNYSQQPEEG